MLESILAPTDFSDGSKCAIRYAAELAQKFEADLVLLNVGVRVGEHEERTSSGAADIYHRAREEQSRVARLRMERLLNDIRSDFPGIKLRSEFADGAAHVAILGAAEQLGVDMIVMGTAGLTGLSHFLIGSTAERVVRVSKVPVLTVRGPE